MKLLLINYLVYGVLLSAVGVSCYSACKDWQPHPSGNCREYIRCVGDSAYVKRCPSTLYFNPILRVCDWPWNVTCGSMSNVTKPPERPPTTPEYVIPPNRPFACPKGVQWGRFPDLESNCQEFYECDRGRCSMGRCPNGLLFNILIISCDLPENTVCPNFRTQPICAHNGRRCSRQYRNAERIQPLDDIETAPLRGEEVKVRDIKATRRKTGENSISATDTVTT